MGGGGGRVLGLVKESDGGGEEALGEKRKKKKKKNKKTNKKKKKKKKKNQKTALAQGRSPVWNRAAGQDSYSYTRGVTSVSSLKSAEGRLTPKLAGESWCLARRGIAGGRESVCSQNDEVSASWPSIRCEKGKGERGASDQKYLHFFALYRLLLLRKDRISKNTIMGEGEMRRGDEGMPPKRIAVETLAAS